MKENEFCEEIDCKFPYNDLEKTSLLITQASNISDNCLFSIIEEIARIPNSEKTNVLEDRLLKILDEVEQIFEHPLKEKTIMIARKMVLNEKITRKRALSIMDEVKLHKGLWGALSTIYDSADDTDDLLDKKFNEIRELWNSK